MKTQHQKFGLSHVVPVHVGSVREKLKAIIQKQKIQKGTKKATNTLQRVILILCDRTISESNGITFTTIVEKAIPNPSSPSLL